MISERARQLGADFTGAEDDGRLEQSEPDAGDTDDRIGEGAGGYHQRSRDHRDLEQRRRVGPGEQLDRREDEERDRELAEGPRHGFERSERHAVAMRTRDREAAEGKRRVGHDERAATADERDGDCQRECISDDEHHRRDPPWSGPGTGACASGRSGDAGELIGPERSGNGLCGDSHVASIGC